ncbi:MAG: hypothetical protein OEL54_05310 [Flavobacteriaceae bacterium]|nr:hypothetical protein [Flavobacteriaceae bacterium]
MSVKDIIDSEAFGWLVQDYLNDGFVYDPSKSIGDQFCDTRDSLEQFLKNEDIALDEDEFEEINEALQNKIVEKSATRGQK